MAYSVETHHLPSFRTYSAAKNYWENAKPWRGRDPNVRPAGTRRQTNITIRKVGESFAIRYHQTDVVTFHVDGSITLIAYPSQSTNRIAQRFLPPNTTVDYNHNGYFFGTYQGRGEGGWRMTKVNKTFSLRPDGNGGWILEGSVNMVQRVVDKQAANKIYKEANYHDFAAFMRAAERMSPPEQVPTWQRYRQAWHRAVSHQYVVEMFEKGHEGWVELADKLPRPTQVLPVVREHLVKEHNCLKDIEVEDASWGNLRNVFNSQRKWG